MKYVKIYDSKMIPLGVVDIEGELPSEASNKYVKVYKPDLSQAGVVQLGAISEAQGSLLVNVYDENMKPCGTSAASVLVPAPTMQAVDLGLPSGTKWGNMNVGAKKATDAGKYFSWGNVNGVSAGDTIDFSGGYEDGEFTGTYGSTAGAALTTDITQGGANDAAAAALGTPWVMPTKTQLEELIDDTYTTMTWTQQNGVNGYLITSKSNGNSIFLPAAGYGDGSALNEVGSYGNYWSSSANSEDLDFAWYFGFDSEGISTNGLFRWFGCSVRPVQNASV